MAAELLDIVKRMGIFIILSQTLLHFRPSKEYEKYIKILCDIMILSMLIIPILSLFQKDLETEFRLQTALFQKQMEQISIPAENADIPVNRQLNSGIEEEVKSRLNNSFNQNGDEKTVTEVQLEGVNEDGSYDADNLHIKITVRQGKTVRDKIEIDRIQVGEVSKNETNTNTTAYRKKCAEILGVSTAYVEVVMDE